MSKKNIPLLFGCLIYFLFCYFISINWYLKGYFSVYDIFFDTDPNTNLASFAHGWGRHAISHPFLEIFTLPIRTIEFIISKFYLSFNKIEFREILALSISPTFSTLKIFFSLIS